MNAAVRHTAPLKVAVLSSASGGGAGIAARRVAAALNTLDEIEADFLDMVRLGGRVPDDAAPPGNMSNRRMTDTHFTVEFPGYVRGWLVDLLEQQYDVLNIHWASFLLGLAEIDELSRRGMPILFTCHDYYYFTGGCHYPATCRNHARGCIACPQVNQDFCSPLVIAANLKIKKRLFNRPNVHLSAPSQFLVNEAVEAGIIDPKKTHVLRNPYFPVPGVTRSAGSGPCRIVLLADSMAERRKRMPLAIESLSLAWNEMKIASSGFGDTPFTVEVIGSADQHFESVLHQAGFEFVLHGRLVEHRRIAELLAGCDFLLTCSDEDNWPNVLVEGGAYGVIPIVGKGHGCEEFVRFFDAGEVATEYTPESFATALVNAFSKYEGNSREEFQQRVLVAHRPRDVARAYCSAIFTLVSCVNSETREALAS